MPSLHRRHVVTAPGETGVVEAPVAVGRVMVIAFLAAVAVAGAAFLAV